MHNKSAQLFGVSCLVNCLLTSKLLKAFDIQGSHSFMLNWKLQMI